jgi:hypothetical protein
MPVGRPSPDVPEWTANTGFPVRLKNPVNRIMVSKAVSVPSVQSISSWPMSGGVMAIVSTQDVYSVEHLTKL